MRQKLCNRLAELERVNAGALAAVRNREQAAETAAWREQFKQAIEAWRVQNSGPEHANESLMETWARAWGITYQELRARLMERAYGQRVNAA